MLRRRFYGRVRDETRGRVGRSAIVFAPHQDDETLGCAGTVLLKRRSGTAVACVFMTDGSTSHRAFMGEEELRAIRRAEALEATAHLGMTEQDVHFLDYRDGRLREFHVQAVAEVGKLIAKIRPDELYVPFRGDGVSDHEATYEIVVDACRVAEVTCEICEYPIWAWNQWPWVSLRIDASRDSIRRLMHLATTGFGMGPFRGCTTGIDVRSVRDEKRRVLAVYRSQMTAMHPGVGWPTLQDLSDGEFLNCFFEPYEVFRCTSGANWR
jgi:LmbE family N-acetylglucosaminyl deacetylase